MCSASQGEQAEELLFFLFAIKYCLQKIKLFKTQDPKLVVELFVFIKQGKIVGHLKDPTLMFDEAILKT